MIKANLSHDTSCCGIENGLISVNDAIKSVLKHSDFLGIEIIPLQQALNRYIAKEVHSNIQLPLFTQSAVDGYAICSQTPLEVGTEIQLIGEVRAGQSDTFDLKVGQAVRIFTGAKLPKHTTTVARQEIVEVDEQYIRLSQSLELDSDIRKAGEEIGLGQILVHKHQQLNIGSIGLLAMTGIQEVTVYRVPKVAVVVTGDEVTNEVENLNSVKIFDANTPLIRAWFQAQHLDVHFEYVGDDESKVKELFAKLRQGFDVIITTGGVSVGDYDFVRPVALDLGFKQIFWKVKQKPGKPLFFAVSKQANQHICYLMGLPGNPAAVFMGLQVYVSTLIHALQARKSGPEWCTGIMEYNLKADTRERFLRVVARYEQGQLIFRRLPNQQSHMLSNLIDANCLVRIPENQSVQVGQILKGLML